MTDITKTWLYSLGFGVAGLLLLWWATEQHEAWRQVAGSQFAMPLGRISLWHVTIVAAGLAFGLAMTTSRRGRTEPRIAMLATLAAIPLAGMLYFYSWILGRDAPVPPLGANVFLIGHGTQVAFPLILGFLISGMIPLRSEST